MLLKILAKVIICNAIYMKQAQMINEHNELWK